MRTSINTWLEKSLETGMVNENQIIVVVGNELHVNERQCETESETTKQETTEQETTEQETTEQETTKYHIKKFDVMVDKVVANYGGGYTIEDVESILRGYKKQANF